jgi:protein O-mannosyl-transferase
MKKTKRPPETKSSTAEAASLSVRPAGAWWPWVAALAGLLALFVVYSPALASPFVLDDRILAFMSPDIAGKPLSVWLVGVRPVLNLSFWLDYQRSATESSAYHTTNVLLHFLGSCLFGLVLARLLKWADVDERKRPILAVFGAALFLLHPVQTESVAYVASRSEVLSVLFFLASFTLFVYSGEESMSLRRALAIVALFGIAIVTKEHTAMLPVLIVATDYFWHRGGVRKNAILYGLLVLGMIAGTVVVFRVLAGAQTAGFGMADLNPSTYFFTQCRVIWTYVRLFVLPLGQNLDADVPLSHSLLDHGAVVGLLALVGAAAAAWIYRKRFPLAAFGLFTFLLLLAPTSSIVPIRDVLAERRLYLPFLGLTLIAIEFLRRLPRPQIIAASAAILLIFSIATYQRATVWSTPLTLWQDTVAKSPNKLRPRFQLAFAQYERGDCNTAAANYEVASKLGPPTYDLLVDWGQALDCAKNEPAALEKLLQAASLENGAHVHALLGMVHAKLNDTPAALAELEIAERADPNFDMTYVYRGIIAERAGDDATALHQYQRAAALNAYNQPARDGVARVEARLGAQ